MRQDYIRKVSFYQALFGLLRCWSNSATTRAITSSKPSRGSSGVSFENSLNVFDKLHITKVYVFLEMLNTLEYCKVRNIGVELLLATLASGLDSLILRSFYICSIFQQFFILHRPVFGGHVHQQSAMAAKSSSVGLLHD